MEFSQYRYISTLAFRSISRSDVTIRSQRWKDASFQLGFHFFLFLFFFCFFFSEVFFFYFKHYVIYRYKSLTFKTISIQNRKTEVNGQL